MCHNLEADPYQLDPVEDAELDVQLARQTRRVLLAIGAPWPAREQYITSHPAA
ncbi:hypothetical protein [Brachybacterium sp. p3-SID957]|uniref:hypothetical protein n=1 Tax=Brachybacterium sp. p3-SID957 TaxID=2916049 RepID=UPI00223A8704|nr:hypothetical protein [Brachybacterium sp. p3-SID957]MCT1776467.1 hypothetical protein [Brachybacterium sp. p3-SID957]